MYLPRKENEDERTRVNEPSHTEEIRGKEKDHKKQTFIHLRSLFMAMIASGFVTSGLKAAYNSNPDVTYQEKVRFFSLPA